MVQNNPYLAKVHDYPELLLPYPTPEQFQALWKPKAKAVQRVHLEIGCGSGRYLSQWAAHFPEDAFLGFELRFKRIPLAAKKLQRNEQSNALLLRERGEFFDDYLQPGTLDVLHVNFPDPWPKKRHHRRRFVTQDHLEPLARVLKPGAEFRVATDIPDYVRQTLVEVPRAGFEWLAEQPQDWRAPWDDWHSTRYEQKALREGRVPHYLTFRRR